MSEVTSNNRKRRLNKERLFEDIVKLTVIVVLSVVTSKKIPNGNDGSVMFRIDGF